jgi:hypothetical protein
MKTKIISLKKIATFCCLLILLAFNNNLHAQIIYTDIPDETPNATYPLDLNNDSIVDFIIQFGGSGSMIGVICSPQNNNAYAGNFVGGVHLPWALSASNNICDTLSTWYESNNPGIMGMGVNIGYWPSATNKYLALKLIVGTNTYYGWARFDLLAISSSFTIKDYAYNSIPNGCIQTGKTNVGGNENSDKNISVFPNPFISSTTIKTFDNLKNAILTIYNSYGIALKQINNISGKTVTLFRENLPNGVYFIRMIDENKTIAVEKLIITD